MGKYKKVYDDFYTKYPDNIHDNPPRFEKIGSLCLGKVLDIGCGTGTLADYIINPYVGIDVSSVAIDKAGKIRRESAVFIQHDITESRLEVDDKFDTIVLAEFLEHIEEQDFDIDSIFDYFSDGGRVIVSVPLADRVPDPTHVREFTIPKLRKIFEKYGDVKFHNWVGEDRRILMTCDTPVKDREKLSLVIIAKNEEMGLETCIMSAIELVDEVVVAVDMSSIDKTKEVAEKFADVVVEFEWRNDFSWARNNAQKHAKYNWVVSLDAHEYIKSVGPIFEEMKGEYDGLWCKLRYEDGMSFKYPRVFRKSCTYKDAVHNLIQCRKMNNKAVLNIIHDRGHLQSKEAIEIRQKQRKEMIQDIMGDRIKKNKKDSRAIFYLATHNQTLKNYKKATKLFRQYLKYSKNVGERWFAMFSLSICYMQLGHRNRAMWWAYEVEKEIPGRWESARLCAMVLMKFGQFRKALDFIVESISDYQPGHAFNPIPFDPSEAWNLMGLCFFNLHQPEKAKSAWLRAIDVCENKEKKQFLIARNSIIENILGGKISKNSKK